MISLLSRKTNTSDRSSTPARDACDAIIVGGGHNGLVCAAILAKSGLKVTVLEALERLGGMATGDEIGQGVRVSTCAHLLYAFDEKLVKNLKLHKYGLHFAQTRLSTIAPDGEGHAVHLHSDTWKTQADLQVFSQADAAAYPDFLAKMQTHGLALHALMDGGSSHGPLNDVAKIERFIELGQTLSGQDRSEFLRLLVSSAGDILDETFETELLKGALAFDSVLGLNTGPRSMNSMAYLLYRHGERAASKQGSMAIVAGTMHSLAQALGDAARAHGASVRTGARVVRIIVKKGKVCGVELEDGARVLAPLVMSNADPKSTYLKLVGIEHLDTEFCIGLKALRSEGVTAKMNLVLNGLPSFRGLTQEELTSRIVICPSVDFAERAFNPVKYKSFSHDPIYEIIFPSLHDAALSSDNRHVLSANVQYVPYAVEGGWPTRRTELVEQLVSALSYFAPDIRDRIISGHVLTPLEIEYEYGCVGGHWHHADFALDQLGFLRPTMGGGAWGAPIAGLYLCGAGGSVGGLRGRAGFLAAERALADLRASRKRGSRVK